MYHINHEGKIYPCRARVLKCPYGEDMHAHSKKELYYKVMTVNRTVLPSAPAIKEARTIGRLKSLNEISDELEDVAHPIETMLSNLELGIRAQTEPGRENAIRKQNEELKELHNEGVEETLKIIRYRGLEMLPKYIPEEWINEARNLFRTRHKSKYTVGHGDGPRTYHDSRELFDSINTQAYKSKVDSYNLKKDYALNEENYNNNLSWLQADFEKYSKDLNISKILTRPVFNTDTVDEAGEKIKDFTDYELLSAYDDYIYTNRELSEDMESFRFEPRADLSTKANKNIEKWYDRNRKIFHYWSENQPRLTLISMKMSDELDKRKLMRTDNLIGRK